MKIVQTSEKTNKIKKMFSIEEILVMVFGLLIRAMTSVHPHSGPVFSMVFAKTKIIFHSKNLSQYAVIWQVFGYVN